MATGARDAGISLMNLTARQRMLSQRMVLQAVLATQGSTTQLQAARQSLALFTRSQATLVDTPRSLDDASVRMVREEYHGAFAVVANVLSGITHQIDSLSLQAMSLAGRNRAAA